jgi:hypothetical protein
MKKPLFPTLVLLLFGVTTSFPQTAYYVASNGLNTNSGASISEPFRTIQKAADIMQSGDTCYIRGGVYRETVTPANSGSSGSPIIFKAYKDEKVTVSGADVLDVSWSVHSVSIYKAKTNLDFNQLFVDGRMMNEARWPNAKVDSLVFMPRANADEGTNSTTLVDAELPPGDWNNARVHITHGAEWISDTRKVTNYQPGDRFSFNQAISSDDKNSYVPQSGNPYYLYHTLLALDTATEWYLDENADEVYLWTPDGTSPADYLVEVKQRNYAFNLSNRSHIELRGLNIFSAAVNMSHCEHVVVDSCQVRYSNHIMEADGYGTDAVAKNIVSGSNNVWKNSVIAYSATDGLTMKGGSNNTVTNCIIHDVNYNANYFSGITVQGRQHEISHNTIYNSGRFIIYHNGARNCRIVYNRLYSAGHLTNDVGITYCWSNDGEGTVIAYNWLHDCYGREGGKNWAWGIYIDDNSVNHIVHHNVVWNVAFCGTLFKDSNELYNNTFLKEDGSNTHCVSDEITSAIAANNLGPGIDKAFGGAQQYNNGDYPVDENFVPIRGAGAIDGGKEIPPFTDDYVGSAPDIGAYEYEGMYWVPGHRSDKASFPIPADQSHPDRDFIDLTWREGFKADTHYVYFGTSRSAVERADHNSPEYKGFLINNMYEPGKLIAGTTYFWRIDALSPSGIQKGEVWSFTPQKDANPDAYDLTFQLYGRKKNKIDSLDKVELVINDKKNAISNSYGKAVVYKLRPGTYTYTLTRKGYLSKSDSFEISSDTTLMDTLNHTTYELTVEVKDKDTEAPVQDCEVEINGEKKVTSGEGEVAFTGVEYNIYDIVARASGYHSFEKEDVEIYSDTTIVLTISRDYPNVNLQVIDKASKEPLNRAVILYEDKTAMTDDSGKVLLDDVVKGKWKYTVKHNDYFTLNDSMFITEDTALVIKMVPKLASITFEVSDSTGPVGDAEIKINDYQYFTDRDGEVLVYNIPAKEDYPYTISKEGYQSITDTIYLEIDTTININLLRETKETHLNSYGTPSLLIYPNPANDRIFIEVPPALISGNIYLLDISGKILGVQKIKGKTEEVDVSTLEEGVYFIKIQLDTFIQYDKFIIHKRVQI